MESVDRALDGGFQGTVLVSHCDVDGSFLIHHFIGKSLHSKPSKVILVALNQTFNHYSIVGHKMGYALSTACEKEELIFIDCLSHVASDIKPVKSQKGRRNFSLDVPRPLQGLSRLIGSLIDEGSDDQSQTIIIIDDLTVLISIGINISDIVSFLTVCRQATNCDTIDRGSLVCFIRVDSDVDDQEAMKLMLYLQHCCRLHVQLSGLSTGLSQSVHGNMLVEKRAPVQTCPGNILRSEMQYKVLDKSVDIFSKGLSVDVL
jgi:hypothetical protein